MTKTIDGILVKCSYHKLVPIEDLIPDPRNPNKHPKKKIKRFGQIIKYQGWTHCVNVSTLSGNINTGHAKVEAASLRGWKEVPVNFIDFEDGDQEYAALVSDNAIAEWSDMDMGLINLEIQNLGPELDINLLGLDGLEIEPADKPQKPDPKPKMIDCPSCGHSFEGA